MEQEIWLWYCFRFDRISYLLKTATKSNITDSEESHYQNAYNINKNRLFVPKTEDPLDTVIDILDDEYVEHKKELHPYVSPQVQTAEEIEQETQLIDDDFARLKAEYDHSNDVATEQKKQKKITDLVDDFIDESNPFQNLGTEDIWIEDDIVNQNDDKDIVDISKDILKNIKENDPFIDFTIPTEGIIDDLFNDDNLTDDDTDYKKVTLDSDDEDILTRGNS